MIRYIVILLSILLRCTVYVWWCMVYATQKDWVVKKKKYAGGGPGGFPPRQKGGRTLIVLAAAISWVSSMIGRDH